MADYDFRYSLNQAPSATSDGSGCVQHDISAQACVQGGDEWVIVPGRHKTISVPAAELQTVLDMSNGAAKVAAYKQALQDNLNTQPVSVTGWGTAQMEALMDANDAATAAATGADEYITVTLGKSYPVSFTI